jgi:hypothetical protein
MTTSVHLPSHGPLGNADCRWERFDPVVYLEHNYRDLRPDDREILEWVRDHFASHFGQSGSANGLVGADVGTGPNLYPALSMLPWCGKIRMIDYAAGNCEWLRGEVRNFGRNWDAFWELLTARSAYAAVADPRAALTRAARVMSGTVFDLPDYESWDLATMFFVAESISARPDEFESAVDRFVAGLRPGAPFAAAFMENSTGYELAGETFPAVPVRAQDVEARFARRTSVDVRRVGLADAPARDGYAGMIVALGVKK